MSIRWVFIFNMQQSSAHDLVLTLVDHEAFSLALREMDGSGYFVPAGLSL